MDTGSISSLASTLTQAQLGNAAGLLVMKKAIDAQAQSALQLLQALPAVGSNPAHLGNTIDIRA
ncbi:MAG: YjfB family protein [Azonexus sp.]|jgi:hypothetical protein|nr:YjfB family protein [Azonexus sp.]